MEVVLWELLQGIGRFFLYPLVYLFILVGIWFGVRRVKRERRDFHTRIYDVLEELTYPLGIGLIFGLVLSVAMVALGVAVPLGMFLLMTVIWFAMIPFRSSRWLSFSFVGSAALIIAYFLPSSGTGVVWIDSRLMEISQMNSVSFVWFLALVVFAEAFLILINGKNRSTSALVESRRGKIVGRHEVNRVWLAPTLLLLPAGGIAATGIGAWPFANTVVGIPTETVGFMLFPVILGFHAIVQTDDPKEGFRRLGGRVMALSILVAAIAGAAYLFDFLTILAAATVILGREGIFWFHSRGEKKKNSMYINQKQGLIVLGVIPHSIGDKMGIRVGEMIMKANGKFVNSQIELYEALQNKAAFCKLEVVDHQGEKRFAQSSVYQGDHYQLGLLFVPDDEVGNLSGKGLRYSLIVQKDRETVLGDSPDSTDSLNTEEEVAAVEENYEGVKVSGEYETGEESTNLSESGTEITQADGLKSAMKNGEKSSELSHTEQVKKDNTN
ncbi:hypothetical protein [Alteribacter populi]|uniref:hypothetical protein n=1 Tax=Alteribacter populi TaxID=2011011 RepID=UPI000BBB1063|nr:hypothetical protein [Alteribacter populi]